MDLGLLACPLGDSDATNMSHVPHSPSARFMCPWFPYLGPGPRWHPPRGVLRWVSFYRPAPWWTVMQPTCHMFLIHLVEYFCNLGFITWGLGPRWHPPRGVLRWVSFSRPTPWGTVMQPTCHMFLIHLVEYFCSLGSPPGAWAQNGTTSDVPRSVSGYRPASWLTVMQPTCHMFLIHLVEDFCSLGSPLGAWA